MGVLARALPKRDRHYNKRVTLFERAKRKLILAVNYERQDQRRLADTNRLAFAIACEEIGPENLEVIDHEAGL